MLGITLRADGSARHSGIWRKLEICVTGLQARLTREGKRLLAEHGIGDDVPCQVGIKAMLGDQVPAFGNDEIGILHDLQLLEPVVPLEPHALADNLEKVEDAERPIALVGT